MYILSQTLEASESSVKGIKLESPKKSYTVEAVRNLKILKILITFLL